jgi:CTP:molybdopterin cytidylyltransferase MocA
MNDRPIARVVSAKQRSQAVHDGVLATLRHRVEAAALACDRSALDDLLFFDAWHRGLASGLSAMFRARQILRAALAAPEF